MFFLLETPLKSPCDQRERGRERAYEQSECASRVSGANDKRRRGESRSGAEASVAEAVRAERTINEDEGALDNY